jgi:hypothetical protein
MIKMTKSRMRWAKHIARIEKIIYSYNIFVGILDVDWKILLKWILRCEVVD